MNKLQRGFTIIETLIALVVIAAIAYVGWNLVHHKASTKTSTSTSSSSSVPVAKTTPTPANSNTSTQKYLTIKEWGIKIPLTSAISDAYYAVAYDNGTIVPNTYSLKVHSLDSEISCKNMEPALVIKATKAQYLARVNGPIGGSVPHSVLGAFYYYMEGSQASCATSKAGQADEVNARAAFLSAATKIVAE